MEKPLIGNAVQMHGRVRAFEEVYTVMMKPLCAELSMPHTELDILLFLANNPECDTARDICLYRHMKPGIVSLYIERLVSEGYLAREIDAKDRRITHLAVTEAAIGIVTRGRALQEQLVARLAEGISPEDHAAFCRCIDRIAENADRIRREAARKKKG